MHMEQTKIYYIKIKKFKIIKNTKNISYDNVAGENKIKHALNWSFISGHPFKILIIEGPGSKK